MNTAAYRFEKRIRVEEVKFGAFLWPWEKPHLHRFHMKNGNEIWASKVFTNFRCEGFYPSPAFEKTDTVNYWDVKNPEAGCIVMAEVIYVEHVRTLEMVNGELGKLDIRRSGFAAFVFNGKSWQKWERPHDVQVYSNPETCELEIAVVGLQEKELVRVNGLDENHGLIAFWHVLDYCAGKRSLADIIALVEAEEHLCLCQERRVVYEQILPLARKLKGAVRSSTGAEIEKLVLGLIQK